jgi:hypothetical protein
MITEQTQRLNEIQREIRKAAEASRSIVFTVGKLLHEAHSLFPKVHAKNAYQGGFAGWVKRECKLSLRHAYSVMNAYKAFRGIEAADRFDDSAMYFLAQPKIPVEARREAFELAKSGQYILSDDARKIAKKHVVAAKLPWSINCNKEEAAEHLKKLARDWLDKDMPDDHELFASHYGKAVAEIVMDAIRKVAPPVRR